MGPGPSCRRQAALGAAFLIAAVVTSGCAAVRTSSPSSSLVEERRPNAAAPRWTVALRPGVEVDVGVVATRVCFDGPAPARVGPEHRGALRFLRGPPRVVDAAGLEVGVGLAVVDTDGVVGIDTSALPAGLCVAFDVDVEAAAREIDQRDLASVVGRTLLISPDVWLWRPKPWPAGIVAGTLVVDDAAKLAAPFVRGADGVFVVRSSTFALQSYPALGSFTSRREHRRGASVVDVVRLAPGGVDDDTLGRWFDTAIVDVTAPGPFPAERTTVLVVPVSGQRPILGGFLGRGGGGSAVFLIADVVSADVVAVSDGEDADHDGGRWVLTHELAHVWLPPVVRADAWFNEGLTTWHQEVLPSSSGRRPRAVARAQLAIGFSTGLRRAKQDGLTLSRACAEMDRFGSYQHCYWGGAALVELLADDVGDDGVFALVRAVHALAPVDAAPATAVSLLQRVEQTSTDRLARRAAKGLLRLWQAHRGGLFPDVDAARQGDGVEWPDES